MNPTNFRLFARVLLAVALGVAPVAAGCGGSQKPGAIQLDKLPAYEGVETQLFDDSIEPAAFGLALDRPSFRTDPKFRERAQSALTVGTYKVTTVTVDKVGDRATYNLRLTRVGDPLHGDPSLETVDLEVREGAPAYGLLRQLESRARGKSVIAMFKRYRSGDEAVVHFYVAPDDPETQGAVREALVLQEVTAK